MLSKPVSTSSPQTPHQLLFLSPCPVGVPDLICFNHDYWKCKPNK